MNLYKVTLKGLTHSRPGAPTEGVSYVVEDNAQEAYNKVKKRLDKEGIGFPVDKVLDKIELIASTEYFGTEYLLYL